MHNTVAICWKGKFTKKIPEGLSLKEYYKNMEYNKKIKKLGQS
jgi:hypothetical protein